ncbi:glycoside hydrolase family 16 protein [Nocardiopsis coralliicola]
MSPFASSPSAGRRRRSAGRPAGIRPAVPAALASLAAAAALGIVAAAPPSAAEPAAGAADLVWSDEFDGEAGGAPDAANWTHETGDHGWGNGELQNYTTSRENSALDGDGNLVITARQEGEGYTSARMVTKDKVEHSYGRVEARIQIPRGQGIWPAFWMLGADFPETEWPNSGEIDIMENVGFEPSTVHGSVHGPGYSGGEGITGGYDHPQGGDFADGFHVYAIDWEPGSITWSVDGEPFHTVTPADTGGNEWVFDQEFFLILNVAVGGEWPGYPDETTEFPQEMKVDYVRLYDS